MAIHGYPGGVVSATAPVVNQGGASGYWTLVRQMYYNTQGKWPPPYVEYLVVAGGGGGGGSAGDGWNGGGGGAGGFRVGTGFTITPGTSYPITVGAGGPPGPGTASGDNWSFYVGINGNDSSFNSITSLILLARS